MAAASFPLARRRGDHPQPQARAARPPFDGLRRGRQRGKTLLAYIACVMAHPAFTARFQADLVRPVCACRSLPKHRSSPSGAARPSRWSGCIATASASPIPPRAAPPRRRAWRREKARSPADGMIPGAPEPLPDQDGLRPPALRRLTIGKGFIDNVPKAVWDYEVSGKNVLRQWFSYRKLDRTRPIIGDRRPPSPSTEHPARPLARRIHGRPDEPVARARPACGAGAGASGAAGADLLRPVLTTEALLRPRRV